LTTTVASGTPKLCAWCEEEIKHPYRRLSAKEWDAVKLHKHCLTSWRHHKCAKKDVPQPPERWCPACEKLLVRREGENWQAWKKRKCCNKSCAATGSVRIRKPVLEVAKEEQLRVGVVQYHRGTEAFKKLALLYGETSAL